LVFVPSQCRYLSAPSTGCNLQLFLTLPRVGIGRDRRVVDYFSVYLRITSAKKNCRIFAKGVFLSFQSKTEMSSRSSSLDNDNLQAPLYKLQAQMPDHVSARHQTFDKIGLKFHKFLPHFQSTNNSFFATCTRGLFLRGESHTLMS
jgi:hypothetical protein